MTARRAIGIFALAAPIAALAVLVVLTMGRAGQGSAAQVQVIADGAVAGADPCAGVPSCNVDAVMDLSIAGTNCNSTGTPTPICQVDRGAAFTISVDLNHLPSSVSACNPATLTTCFEGYDARVHYSSGLTPPTTSGVHLTGEGDWPDCGFPAFSLTDYPNEVSASCAVGIGSTSSTYTGSLLHLDFTCSGADSVEALDLIHGYSQTDLQNSGLIQWVEPIAQETLTIYCGNPPSPTPTPSRTPGGPTDTATPPPTDTPTPLATNTPLFTNTPTVTPTRTPRRDNVLAGDVDGDLMVTSLDALWVLWFSAGIVPDVPFPDAADLDQDDVVNATDALFILWVEADQVFLL
jgi:hypothetical protein